MPPHASGLLAALVIALAACTTQTDTGPILLPGGPTATVALRQLPTATPTPLPPTDLPPELAPPTPTPTPVTHSVAEGETLLGIAIQYGVTVEALTAANPQVNPRLLSVGTLLTIPTGDSPMLAGLPSPTPQPLTLGLVSCQPAPTGLLTCLTDVTNIGTRPVTNVSMRIRLLDAGGIPVAEDLATLPLAVLPPGTSAPLGVRFINPPGYNAAQALLQTADDASDLLARYPLLSVEGVTILDDSPVTVAATLSHTQPAVLTDIVVIVVLYLPDGRVRAYRQVTLTEPLPPNTNLTLSLPLTVTDATGNRAVVLAQGRRLP